MQERERIEGTILYITFSSPDTGFTVLELQTDEEMVTVVGEMVGLAPGQRLVVWGNYTNHPSFGVQFKAQSYEVALPEEENAILLYLSSGAVKGLGPVTASRIMEKFGKNALDVIENNPSWLCDIKGISPKRAREINESYVSQFGMRECLMFCRSFFGPALSVKIYRRYGSGAVEIIRQNPYRLCTEVPGVGFERADRLAMSVGFPADGDERIEAGVRHVLTLFAYGAGHCCVPRETLVSEAARVLSCYTASVSAAVKTALGAYAWEGLAPARMVRSLNEFLLGFSRIETFATLFVGIVDLSAGTLRYCSAGHPPALLIHDGADEISILDVQSGVVGAFHDMTYVDGKVSLAPGDVLLLYTDGTTEARDPSGAFFGEEGLRDMVMRESADGKPFEGFVERLLATLDDFTGHDLEDDVAMVAVRFDGTAEKGGAPAGGAHGD